MGQNGSVGHNGSLLINGYFLPTTLGELISATIMDCIIPNNAHVTHRRPHILSLAAFERGHPLATFATKF